MLRLVVNHQATVMHWKIWMRLDVLTAVVIIYWLRGFQSIIVVIICPPPVLFGSSIIDGVIGMILGVVAFHLFLMYIMMIWTDGMSSG